MRQNYYNKRKLLKTTKLEYNLYMNLDIDIPKILKFKLVKQIKCYD